MSDMDEMPEGGMSFEEFMAQPVPIRTDPESVARAVRYLEWWLPVGAPSLGSATEDAVKTLMQFAREHVIIRTEQRDTPNDQQD